MRALREEYGDIVYYRLAFRNYCAVFDPELIRELLLKRHSSFRRPSFLGKHPPYETSTILTSEGEEHTRHRRLHGPSFGGKSRASYSRVMIDKALAMRDGWSENEVIDGAQVTTELAIEVAVSTFFGPDRRVEPEIVWDVLQGMIWNLRVGLLPGAGLIRKLPLPIARRSRRAWESLDKVIYDVIRSAREPGSERSDLISLMTLARDEEGGQPSFSDAEIKSEAYAMLIVGHETSATAMAWSLEFIMRHPEVRERIEREVDAVVGQRRLVPEDFNALTYTRAVFNETLRHRPPVYFVGLEALDDCVVAGHLIPRGTIMQPYFPEPHVDDSYFERGSRFDPEPWLDARASERMKKAWFPFGYGPRLCIAWHFATMEAVFALASIAQCWRLEPARREPARVKASVVYTPEEGSIQAIVRKRKASRR